mgnify:CR=1 FL=1
MKAQVMRELLYRYVKVPLAFLKHLGHSEALMLSQLMYLEHAGEKVFASDEQLSFTLGVSTKTIQRTREKLRDSGYVDAGTAGIGSGMSYTVDWEKVYSLLASDTCGGQDDQCFTGQDDHCDTGQSVGLLLIDDKEEDNTMSHPETEQKKNSKLEADREEFEKVWKTWRSLPRKGTDSKHKAFTAWRKFSRKHRDQIALDIPKRQRLDYAQRDHKSLIPMFTSYLNGRYWEQEFEETKISAAIGGI